MSPAPRPLAVAVDAAYEAAVVPSFTSIGYRTRSALFGWQAVEGASLAGRTVMVTGANSGLGFETASQLRRLGADVVVVARNPDRGRAAVEALGHGTAADGAGRVRLEQADMASVEDVRRLAGRVAGAGEPLAGVVHNAGAIIEDRTVTPDGLEATFAAMVVGPHLLTRELLPLLAEAGGRVVWMTSGGLYTTRLHLDDLQFEHGYSGTAAYARAKRAQVDLVAEWARRDRSGVVHAAVHPGWADTPGVRESLPTFHRLLGPVLRTPAQGVDTAVWALTSEEVARRSGELWFDRRRRLTGRLPGTVSSPDLRARLWDEVERLAG